MPHDDIDAWQVLASFHQLFLDIGLGEGNNVPRASTLLPGIAVQKRLNPVHARPIAIGDGTSIELTLPRVRAGEVGDIDQRPLVAGDN